MKNIIKPATSVFLIIIFFFFYTNTTAQNKIKLPVYIINAEAFKSLFIKGKHSKIVTNLKIENADLDLGKTTSLELFSFSTKEKKSGSNTFEKYQSALLFPETFDTTFVNFSISNNEVRISDLLPLLPDYKQMAEDVYYFVPSIIESSMNDKKFFTLIYVLKYLDKEKKNALNQNGATGKPTLGGGDYEPAAAVLTSLTAIKAFNPCPPARPAEY